MRLDVNDMKYKQFAAAAAPVRMALNRDQNGSHGAQFHSLVYSTHWVHVDASMCQYLVSLCISGALWSTDTTAKSSKTAGSGRYKFLNSWCIVCVSVHSSFYRCTAFEE